MGICAKYRYLWIILAWTAAIALAACCDRFVAAAVHRAGTDAFLDSHSHLKYVLKLPGFFPFTIILAVAVGLLHPRNWRASIFLFLCGVTAGTNQLIKFIAGRARPFRTIQGYSPMLTPFDLHPFPSFAAKNLCFPSGHAALAFATAASLSILWPRWRWGFYLIALLVAAERVLENAHWLSDTVAAAALGIGGVWEVRRLWWTRCPANDVNVHRGENG
jgi:membrane-associated phospholipid phosphatase